MTENAINDYTNKLLDKAYELLGSDNPRTLRIAFDIAKHILPDTEVEPDASDAEERSDIDEKLDELLAGGG